MPNSNDGLLIMLTNVASEYGLFGVVIAFSFWHLAPIIAARKGASKASSEIYEEQLRGMSARINDMQIESQSLRNQMSSLVSSNSELSSTVYRLERLNQSLASELKLKDTLIEKLQPSMSAGDN